LLLGHLGCILGFSGAFGVAAWHFLKLLLGLIYCWAIFGYCCVAEFAVVPLQLLLTSFSTLFLFFYQVHAFTMAVVSRKNVKHECM